MSGIDPRYILMPVLWEVFTDKDLLTFLANGYILFFKDLQRTVGKEVFKLTGTPPAYNYVAYGSLQMDGSWRIDLNAQGALDEALYFFPYDINGNNENYYIEWYSSGGVLQNDREAWPNLPTTGGVGTLITSNLVPNPQFLLHTVAPASGLNVAGQITQPITPVAYGGWTFERSVGSTAKDVVTFLRNSSPISNPLANPRYWINVNCISPGGDAFKRLCLTFNDVNKFANSSNEYTVAFNAYASGSGFSSPLQIIQNFGTGGSATVITTLTTFSITTSNAQYSFSFVFPTTIGKTIGPNDDDFVQIVIGLPPNAAFSGYFTDDILTLGNIPSPQINDQPDSVYVYQSTAGFLQLPAYDGSDAYLPIILTPTGLGYDSSSIGQIIASIELTPPKSYLLLDGTQYKTDGISSDGIPYSRLQAKLFAATGVANVPIWGTGANFVTEVIFTTAALNNITHFTNKAGAVVVPANGVPSPGFTFLNLNGTPNTFIQANAYYDGTNILLIQNITQGKASSFDATKVYSAYDGNSTNTVTVLAYGFFTRQQVEVDCVAGSAITGGHYFVYYTPSSSFYVWYKVNGAGGDPAPPGISHGIEVDILSTYTSADVARMTAVAINGYQVAAILTVAAGAIPQSSYWTFSTLPANNYYVWYNTSGGGTDPAPGGTGIMVALTGTETNAQVATKTQIAINSAYFAVGAAYGAFLRCLDPTAGTFDPDSTRRFMLNHIVGGAIPGSFQLDGNQDHGHNFYPSGGAGTFPSATFGNITPSADVDTTLQLMEGLRESRPYNMAVNYFIKY